MKRREPLQMDDYGQVPEPHHCGEDVNDEDNLTS